MKKLEQNRMRKNGISSSNADLPVSFRILAGQTAGENPKASNSDLPVLNNTLSPKTPGEKPKVVRQQQHRELATAYM
jgi:hypothetical protein